MEDVGPIFENDDPERLLNLTSRVVARGFERVPILKKLSRNAEGENKRSGIVSDVLGIALEIYARNSDEIQTMLVHGFESFSAKRRERNTTKENGS